MFPILITVTEKESFDFVVINMQGVTRISTSKGEGTQINRIDELPLFVNQTPEDIERLMRNAIVDMVWNLAEEFKQRERDLAAGKGGKNGGKRGS